MAYPNAVKCGMTKHDFFHSTMRDVNLRIKSYREDQEYRAKEIKYQSWLTGLYVQNAISSCFSKKAKYPKNPLKEEIVVEDMKLTENEADFYRDQFMKRLQRMEKRFNESKKGKEAGAGEI